LEGEQIMTAAKKEAGLLPRSRHDLQHAALFSADSSSLQVYAACQRQREICGILYHL
jgi:hypothetical protein